jgi:hypothetical protein
MIKVTVKHFLGAAFLVLAAYVAPSAASMLPLNFNDFTAIPVDRVAISSDGSTAVFSEDPIFSPITLEHLNFAVPDNAVTLSFDYELAIPAGNEDYFDFYLNDLTTPIFSQGGLGLLALTGSPVFDLTPYSGGKTSLVFHLIAGFGDQELTSQLTLRNPRLSLVSIDETSTFLLLTLGLAGFLARYRFPMMRRGS